MCLDITTTKVRNPNRMIRGWKVFDDLADGLHFEFYDTARPVQNSIWHTARRTRQSLGYPCGFHIFAVKGDADFWAEEHQKVVAVLGRCILAQGRQTIWTGRNLKVYVCRELKIPKPKKGAR